MAELGIGPGCSDLQNPSVTGPVAQHFSPKLCLWGLILLPLELMAQFPLTSMGEGSDPVCAAIIHPSLKHSFLRQGAPTHLSSCAPHLPSRPSNPSKHLNTEECPLLPLPQLIKIRLKKSQALAQQKNYSNHMYKISVLSLKECSQVVTLMLSPITQVVRWL